jgi:hypothetical protein
MLHSGVIFSPVLHNGVSLSSVLRSWSVVIMSQSLSWIILNLSYIARKLLTMPLTNGSFLTLSYTVGSFFIIALHSYNPPD